MGPPSDGAPILFFAMTRMGFAGFYRVMIALVTVPARKVRVMGGGYGVLRLEISLCFSVMLRGFFVMVRRIVRWRAAGCAQDMIPPEIIHSCGSLLDDRKYVSACAPFFP